MIIHPSLGAYPGMTHLSAARLATARPSVEPLFGPLDPSHLQLCPQNLGTLDEAAIDALLGMFPHTTFRLHANVKVSPKRRLTDLVRWNAPGWADEWCLLARASKRIHAPAYSGHAGLRRFGSLMGVVEGARRLTDLFGCPVAIEGHYPTPGRTYLFDCWAEYRQLLEHEVFFAIDLSHLHIVAHHEGPDIELVKALVSHPRCIEVHLSDNDGRRDSHRVLTSPRWWHEALDHIHPEVTIFSESSLLRRQSVHEIS